MPTSLRYVVRVPKLSLDIVDDHELLRECISTWISANKPSIDVVGRYGSWDEVTANLHALSDVVLLDVVLGDAVPLRAKILTILTAGSQVVVFSALTHPGVVWQAFDAGALAFIPKTEGIHTLIKAITAAAKGLRFVLPAIEASQQQPRQQFWLTIREHEAVSLYLSGPPRTIQDVGLHMGISINAAKQLIGSAKRKARPGHDKISRIHLRRILVEEGWIIDET